LWGVVVFYSGCAKSDPFASGAGKLYIRIAQVDKDGIKTFSRVVTAITE
jgi:hypothetical protein